ncbi:hypothetical protein F511_03224 [Dorcoceras hygrometricum]|uniref:GIR1-like zinc ribbon domain-containing protein n=1 Tax=Dorcoceras hygrometricum TaxID=472368 RepID=A0A2Z7B265_9LAMI|nr:hypothetical protein F511_03224 [Dorcoceras hygrometricum]
MSRRNVPKLELKLNKSPPRMSQPRVESPSRSSSTSPASSCLSSDGYSTSPEATSMLLVGCPNCLMYVMLAEEDPRCPKCKTTVLLDVFHDDIATTTNKNPPNKKLG